ncbi:MAG: DNA mismatch repair protein MutS [Candidatus Omnitrophota bacterium]|jgi:DNA mismatch repair protein MutS
MDNLTPMLKQYQEIKSKHQNCILFYRLGDFYEMFYEDARQASAILGLVLTSRGTLNSAKVPMCGIPYHAAETYIAKLIKAGLKVGICEQVEDPAKAIGIVKREVVRVITSGTFIDESGYGTRYLISLAPDQKKTGISFIDTASGNIQSNEYNEPNKVLEIISKLAVHECVFPISKLDTIQALFKHPLLRTKDITLTPYEDWCFNPELAKKSLTEHFHVHNLSGFGIDGLNLAIASAGALLEYVKQMSHQPMRHIDKISLYTDTHYVFLSPSACYGLELESLFTSIDHTLTTMGKRKLKDWIYQPLKSPQAIQERQHAISLLKDNPREQEELGKLLRNIPDMEKSISRISGGYATFKDLLALQFTLLRVPDIKKAIFSLAAENRLFQVKDLLDLRGLLTRALNPEVPLSHPEGKIIRQGYHAQLDSLRDIQENGKQWLKNLQAEEIKRTKINSLKIGYNQVFGYYIEISKANLHLAPVDYIRKQTLVNAERFVTPEIKEFEEKMLNAEENILKIENDIIQNIQKEILDRSESLHGVGSSIATIDSLYSLSALAKRAGYCRPQITEDAEIIIKDGRHPVVEQFAHEPFIPNDTLLDCQENHLLIITGPNMAGKSTYIRQTAILVILAQMGSFIPASSARIGCVDKIFTRIGAHDDISKGQSTFMVEMSETAGILNNLSERSLVILDEIGRGTSTYDGLSLAWAVAEYLQKHKTRCLFATHFHELTILAEEFQGVKNYNVEVKEWNEEVIFLHKIIPGGSDDSYGIYVAKLAGIPYEVIQRSKHILTELEIHSDLKNRISSRLVTETQIPLFDEIQNSMEAMKKEIEQLDINSLTPIEALNKLQEIKQSIKKNG